MFKFLKSILKAGLGIFVILILLGVVISAFSSDDEKTTTESVLAEEAITPLEETAKALSAPTIEQTEQEKIKKLEDAKYEKNSDPKGEVVSLEDAKVDELIEEDNEDSIEDEYQESLKKQKAEKEESEEYDSSLVRDYDIVEENDISIKALTKSLSAYTQEELNSLPVNMRKEYRVVISPTVSKEELKSTLIQVVMDKTSKNNDIDEVVVFAYDRKEDVNGAFTLGKVEWCPNGDWGSMTPQIASGNDRSSYQYVFDLKDKVGNVETSDRPTDREYEIYDYYTKCWDAESNNVDWSDPEAKVDEDLVIKKVAEKYGISEEEVNRICDKVVMYQMT